MSVFDPIDSTVSRGNFAWVGCGRFWTAREGPLYPLLTSDKEVGLLVIAFDFTSKLKEEYQKLELQRCDLEPRLQLQIAI
jgi:hypothetical protein